MSIFFTIELGVHVPKQVLAEIVAHVKLFKFSVLAQFLKYVLVEILEMFSQERLIVFDGLTVGINEWSGSGIGVHFGDEQSLGKSRAIVDS